MASDRDIRRLHADGWDAESIARKLGHSVDSVRGRIHRASLEDRIGIAQELAEATPLTNGGVQAQQILIAESNQVFEAKQEAIRRRGGLAKGVFISDLHVPYTNWTALYLALLIIEHVNPDYISGFNDLFDMEGYGRWPDFRSPAAMLWGDDIANALKVAGEIHAAYHKAAPRAMILDVRGNHDNWVFDYLRVFRTGFTEYDILSFMEKMREQGVMVFSDGQHKHENIIQLSPGLKWVHGVSAAKNPATTARATLEQLSENGVYFNVTSGHTHRAADTPLFGVHHWNNGCLHSGDPVYMKFRPHWSTTITVNVYDPNSRYTLGEIVHFNERGGHLVARYDGIDFDVPLGE